MDSPTVMHTIQTSIASLAVSDSADEPRTDPARTVTDISQELAAFPRRKAGVAFLLASREMFPIKGNGADIVMKQPIDSRLEGNYLSCTVINTVRVTTGPARPPRTSSTRLTAQPSQNPDRSNFRRRIT
jgi:hypothetical protein